LTSPALRAITPPPPIEKPACPREASVYAGLDGCVGAESWCCLWEYGEKAEGDARWIGEFADELTVTIALGEWDQAVTFVEQGQQSLL